MAGRGRLLLSGSIVLKWLEDAVTLRTFPAHINSRSLTDFKDRSKTDFRKLSAEERTEELFGLISHLVPLSTQLADVVNALSARFHGMEDRKDIQHEP